MDKKEKSEAAYLHSCLKFVNNESMTNSFLRERFGIKEKNRAMVSRVISDAVTRKLVKPVKEGQSRKYSKYLPYWA
ncbi:MAG: hypothetical protein ACOCJN_01235 [Spirochaetaceae bacterium JB067]